MRTIWPDALDFTSTRSIGSTVPVASMVSAISRRWTASVITGTNVDRTLARRTSTTPAIAPLATIRTIRVRKILGWTFTCISFRAASQVPPHQRLELRLGDALVVARPDQIPGPPIQPGPGRPHRQQEGASHRRAAVADPPDPPPPPKPGRPG